MPRKIRISTTGGDEISLQRYMENYFWVASQNHFFELKRGPHYIHYLSSREVNIDVLALVGPNTRDIEVGQKKRICLVRAIMTRAFEIALLLERQTSMTPLKGYWLDTAKSLIGDVAQSSCEVHPCPVYYTEGDGDVLHSDFPLAHRIQIDVSECSNEDIHILKWALADLERPVTALGRAWGSQKYALIGAPDWASEATQAMPQDLWAKILSLLSRLGVKDLTPRLARAAVFVWDLVDCPVHRGLGKTTVVDLAEDYCRCSICDESRQEVKLWAPQEQTLEAYSNESADELTHKWWTSGKTARPDEGLIHSWWTREEIAGLSEDNEVPDRFKLRPEISVGRGVKLPTAKSFKLRTVKTLAQLEDFRLLLVEHLCRAENSSCDVAELPQTLLYREIERFISHSHEVSASVAGALLEISPARTPGNLVLRIERLHAERSSTAHLRFFYELSGSQAEWPRLKCLSPRSTYGRYPKSTNYLVKPCRLFTVSAVDNPLYNFQDCKSCPTRSLSGPYDYDSTVELSTRAVMALPYGNRSKPQTSAAMPLKGGRLTWRGIETIFYAMVD